MPRRTGADLDLRALDRIIAGFQPKAERLVATMANYTAGQAMAHTTRVDTGTMRRGWIARRLDRLRWRVGNNVSYVVFHEFGTSKLVAAPMLGPALEDTRRRLPGWVKGLFKT